jgi:hypothetical protein
MNFVSSHQNARPNAKYKRQHERIMNMENSQTRIIDFFNTVKTTASRSSPNINEKSSSDTTLATELNDIIFTPECCGTNDVCNTTELLTALIKKKNSSKPNIIKRFVTLLFVFYKIQIFLFLQVHLNMIAI